MLETPMSRLSYLAVLAVLFPVRADAAPQPEKKKPLPVRMKETLRFKAIEDPKTSLAEALEQLQKLHDITFEVNEKVFREAGLENMLLSVGVATPQPMPEMTI